MVRSLTQQRELLLFGWCAERGRCFPPTQATTSKCSTTAVGPVLNVNCGSMTAKDTVTTSSIPVVAPNGAVINYSFTVKLNITGDVTKVQTVDDSLFIIDPQVSIHLWLAPPLA